MFDGMSDHRPIAWFIFGMVLFYAYLLRQAKTKVNVQPEEESKKQPGQAPFASREEYLKAREEMELGQFLDRCWQTPDSIKKTPRDLALVANDLVQGLSKGIAECIAVAKDHENRPEIKKLIRFFLAPA